MKMNEVTMRISMVCTTAISLILLRAYLNSFFDGERNKSKKVLGWLSFCIWQCIINSDIFVISMSSSARLLFTIGTAALVVFVAYQGEIWKKCMLTAIYITLWMALETLLWFFMDGNNARTYVLAVSLVSKTLLLAIVMGVRFFMNSKPKRFEIAKSRKSLITMPLGSIALCYILVEIGQEAGFEKTKIRICLIAGALLLIAVNLSILYAKIMENREAGKNSAFYIQQLESYKQQHIEEAIAEIRETRHDFKQTLLYLETLAAVDNERFQKALVKTTDETLAKGKIVGVTGCLPADAVLLKVMQVSQERNIRFSPCLKIPPELEIDDNDLCVLLGNALDNAIEAVEPLTESEREIHLDIDYRIGILNIKIRNRYQGELKWIEYGKRLKSKKQEGTHGLGLQSISKIVLKYHGGMNISQADGFFALAIWMYG